MNECRVVLPNSLKNLSNNDKTKFIKEHVSGELKQNIAIEYFVNRKCQIDIAIELNLCSKTIYNKIKGIKKELGE